MDNLNKLFVQLVENRGYGRDFLLPDYEKMADPEGLPDMRAAAERLVTAAEKGEKVMIYGDYDVDGVTATAVMYDILRLLGVREVITVLPHRVKDGYGMGKKMIERATEEGVDLVVTVDCGSRNVDEVAVLKELGVEVVITDHHECGEKLPEAVAVVNPKRRDVEVPAELKSLAGVGVAFMVARELVKMGKIPAGQEKWLLDLVLVGTICDSMPMVGENRRLCYWGKTVLKKTRRPGLQELMRVAKVDNLNTEMIGFRLGPRINAAGRLDSAELALKMILTENRAEAAQLAKQLEVLNAQRQEIQRTALSEITKTGVGEERVIVQSGEWHEGVLGIIAGKLVEEYQRPAFVLAKCGENYKGSGRSFGEFNLAQALMANSEVILGGGGHAEACGVTVASDRLGDFAAAMNDYYESLGLKNQERFLRTREDLVLESLEGVDLDLVDGLAGLEPYGPMNEEPVFLLADMMVERAQRMGVEEQHLRLDVVDEQGRELKLVAFFAPKEWLEVKTDARVDVWVRLAGNEWRGQKTVEGRIEDLRVVF